MPEPASEPAIPLSEFDQEMATTRRLLERVPADRGEWKPHEKSFALGHLAQLVAAIPGWIAGTLRDPRTDLAEGEGYAQHDTAALVAMFDRSAAAGRAALAEVVGDALGEPWSLTHGEHVLLTMPRGEAARQHLRHLAHHRGQLTVYARLLDVPVPQIYGPTADERGPAGGGA